MSTYAIGDIQGCYDELMTLLDTIGYDSANDQLWFAGDLVNRGTRSVDVLRFVRSLGDRAICVLGNHDLHLLAVHAGIKKSRSEDLNNIFRAEDGEELLDWLRHQPLLHYDEALGYVMVHAGLAPQWDLVTAQRLAQELQNVLRGDNYREFLANMYGDKPALWNENLTGWERLRFICNSFTRIRFCTRKKGKLAMEGKGAPKVNNKNARLVPWFNFAERQSRNLNIIFGHWSTLGNYHTPGIYCLDTGCVWGGKLTALRLESQPPMYLAINCAGAQDPMEFI